MGAFGGTNGKQRHRFAATARNRREPIRRGASEIRGGQTDASGAFANVAPDIHAGKPGATAWGDAALVCPHATKAEVVGKILHLRQHYHFGPARISMYLKRYHEVSVSPSGIWRILKRANLNRLPASQRYKRHTERWKRYEKQKPGHSVQIDVKFIEPIKGVRKKHYQYTAIDDCTRLRVLRIYERLDQKTAIRFVDYVLEQLPFQVMKI